MKPTPNDNDFAALDAIHESVLAIDASRPVAGDVVRQWFGLINAAKGED